MNYNMTAEEFVKEIYPDAICERDGVFWFVRSGNTDLGAAFTEANAWGSASEYIRRCKLFNII